MMDFDTIYGGDMNEDFDLQNVGEVDYSAQPNGLENMEINFPGRGTDIDDLYDPHIFQAKNDFIQHAQDYLDADTSYQARMAINHMREATNSENYWEDCKRSAQIEAEKDRIFMDGINAKLAILEKYRKQ